MTNKAAVIREFEEILSGKRDFDKTQDNWTLFKAYENSKNVGNARLDFDDVIWDYDIKPIADTLRKSGIKEFTISVHQGNLLEILTAFQELGIFIKGMVKVKVRFLTNEASAILMQVA